MALVQNATSAKSTIELDIAKAKKAHRFRFGEMWFWAALIIAVVLDLFYVKAYAVDVICMDEWAFIPYLQQFNEGRLDFGHFLSWQHNQHKLFFPLMILFSIARCTHYDERAVEYAGLVIMSLTALGVLLIARKRLLSKPFGSLCLAIIAFFMLELRQWENLINGFSCSTVAVSMFFVFTVYLLDSVRKFDWRICLAAGSAFLATFCCANGLLCWPLGCFMLIASRVTRGIEFAQALMAPIAAWLAVSGAVLFYYFSTYEGVRKDSIGNIAALCSHGRLIETMQTFLASFANPLCFEPYSAVAGGAAVFTIMVGVGLAVALGKWQITEESTAPLALLLVGLLSTAMILIGRAIDGIPAILASRYASITSLSIVGLLIFVATLRVDHGQKRTAVVSALCYAMFVATVASGLFGITVGENVRKEHLIDAEIMRNYQKESDQRLSPLLPFPKVLRLYAPYLQQEGYSVFRRPVSARPASL